MALKKSEKRMLKLLAVVVVAAGIFEFIGSGKHKPPPKKPAPKSSLLSAPFAKSKLTKTPGKTPISKKVHYDTWGRDPFYYGRKTSGGGSGSGKKKKESKPPVLKGIFWKQGRVYVLIDSSILREGEEKAGLTVEKIKGTEVLCRKGKRLFTLRWRESP